MNKKRREKLAKIIGALQTLNVELDEIASEEESAMEALPDGIRNSESGQAMEEAVSQMREAFGNIEGAVVALESIE